MFEAHKINTLQVGKFYKVWHAECEWRGKTWLIPVNPNLHKDPQFGGISACHYHIDGRFFIPLQICQDLYIHNGYTNHAVFVPKVNEYIGAAPLIFKQLVLRTSKCIRLTTGTKPPLMDYSLHPSKWYLWYQKQIGKSCAGKKCPHRGASMIDNGTHLVCPLHNLHGDRITEIIIEYPEK
jgi:hypothetical protein